MADLDLASLRSTTPDGKIRSKDKVFIDKDIISLTMGYKIPSGVYFFDSYDTIDDTCFIARTIKDIPNKAHKKLSGFCYHVKLTDIRVVNAT